MSLPHDVSAASWGPDDTSFAYIDRPARASTPERLYAGRTLKEARTRSFPLSAEFPMNHVLGWVDERHVVIGHYRGTVHIVDVVTGDMVEQPMDGYGRQKTVPLLAADLWQHPLTEAVAPSGTTDPRIPWRWATGAVLASFAGVLLVRRRRRKRVYDGSTTVSPSMHRLGTVVTGLIIVILDFRVHGIDLIPDPIGWAMAASALCSMRALHRGFYVAGIAAWLAVIPSLPEWFGAQGSLLTVAFGLALVVIQVATCTALMAVSPARHATAATIRWLTVGLGAAVILALVVTHIEPSALILAVATALADVAVSVWFLLMLYGVGKARPAQAVPALRV